MEILPQLIAVAIVSSALYSLIATGLTMTFGILEFIHFGYGEMAITGAYIFYTCYMSLGMGLIPSALIALASVTLIGVVIEKFTFKPVRERHWFIPMTLSIGIAIILQSAMTIFYGGNSRNYYASGETAKTFELFNGSVIITDVQIAIVLIAIACLLAVGYFLKYSRTGKAARAVADDRDIAAIMGINVDKTISTIFGLGSLLAVVAGIMLAFDRNLTPTAGMLTTVIGFCAIVLGGVGSFKGAIIGAIIIGFAETLVIGLTPLSNSYKEIVIFTILLLTILIRPYGLFGGTKEEVESRK